MFKSVIIGRQAADGRTGHADAFAHMKSGAAGRCQRAHQRQAGRLRRQVRCQRALHRLPRNVRQREARPRAGQHPAGRAAGDYPGCLRSGRSRRAGREAAGDTSRGLPRDLRFRRRARPDIKVAINHQLQFHPRRLVLQRLVNEGAIGKLRFVDASSGLNLAYQGTHSLQAIGAFTPGLVPTNGLWRGGWQ